MSDDYFPYDDSFDFEQLMWIDQLYQEVCSPIQWDNGHDFVGYLPRNKDMKMIFKMSGQEITILLKFPNLVFINEKSHLLLLIPETYTMTPSII